ncbi:MAG: insulinase family protein [Prevotella sp.]|nr:insulinase family protein [Prevotella sp.]
MAPTNGTTRYNTHTLSCGLRIIHLPSDSDVVYCGYQVAAGTRHEQPGEEGIAHFCEHMTFKGTGRRNALQIINSLERFGGDLNAFTNKEDTTYYCAIQRQHIANATDLLTDIVFSSTYPQAETEKEVEVVCDEIESYNDTPAELIYDEFENLLFEGHPLGHNILGDAQQLRTYTSSDLQRFSSRYYRPDNAIFFAYGNLDFARLVRLLEKALDKITPRNSAPQTPSATLPTPKEGETIIKHRDTHQAHVMIGTRSYDIHHPRRIALYLLNNILGGPGMNARLNLSLRERYGLVYTVESSMVSYSDTGVWSIYFGCDPHDTKRCLRLVRRELDRIMQHPLSGTQIAAAKRQLKGQIAIACDNREQFALDFGKSYLHYGWEKDVASLFNNIDSITSDDLQQVANELFAPQRLTTLIYQ